MGVFLFVFVMVFVPVFFFYLLISPLRSPCSVDAADVAVTTRSATYICMYICIYIYIYVYRQACSCAARTQLMSSLSLPLPLLSSVNHPDQMTSRAAAVVRPGLLVFPFGQSRVLALAVVGVVPGQQAFFLEVRVEALVQLREGGFAEA